MTSQSDRQLMSVSEVLRILDIPRHRLTYLFESRKLKAEEFERLQNGQRVYRQNDLNKIKQALFEVSA
jgi:DNA-binding transcriptional MerR regulator